MVSFIFMIEKGLKEGKPNARLSFMRLVAYRVAPLFVVAMVFGIFWDIVLGKIENVDISWFFFNYKKPRKKKETVDKYIHKHCNNWQKQT